MITSVGLSKKLPGSKILTSKLLNLNESLTMFNGGYNESTKENLDFLLKTHFPGYHSLGHWQGGLIISEKCPWVRRTAPLDWGSS